MPSRLEDEKHWRNRAEQMRALAAAMPDQQTVILMTDLAQEYDKLAEKAALRAKEDKSQIAACALVSKLSRS